MLTEIIKFLHIIFMLGLCGTIIYAIAFTLTRQFAHEKGNLNNFNSLNKLLLALAGMALLTGTLLVHPRNFTFHTAWIQFAYLLLTLFAMITGGLLWLNYKKFSLPKPAWLMIYLFLGSLLLIAIHDAVTKMPLLN